MSATDSGSPSDDELSDHAYFRAVEDAFIRLRGAPFLLSPEDWRVACGWRRAGIPLELVERVLERVLRRRDESEKDQGRRIRSLRYFDSAVGAAWKSLRAVAGSEAARRAAPIEVERRLAALAAALPDLVPRRDALIERLLALRGATEEVEEELAVLDREMLAGVRDVLGAGGERELMRRVEAGLARVGRRLSVAELGPARERLERQVLRRMLDLPLLSLFSVQARD